MVASVGDSRAGRVAYVPLTSAHLHYRTAGDKAARLLLDQLADPHARPRELELGWELKCRASTGCTPFLCKVPNTHVKLCEIDNTSKLNCVTWRIEIYRPINYNILVR